MTLVHCLPMVLAFLYTIGRQPRNHSAWRDRTNYKLFFHLMQHLREPFWCSQCTSAPNILEWKREIIIPLSWSLFATIVDTSTQPKVYDAKSKPIISKGSLVTISLRLIHHIFMVQWTGTYHWDHLLEYSGSLVGHLIQWSMRLTLMLYEFLD